MCDAQVFGELAFQVVSQHLPNDSENDNVINNIFNELKNRKNGYYLVRSGFDIQLYTLNNIQCWFK